MWFVSGMDDRSPTHPTEPYFWGPVGEEPADNESVWSPSISGTVGVHADPEDEHSAVGGEAEESEADGLGAWASDAVSSAAPQPASSSTAARAVPVSTEPVVAERRVMESSRGGSGRADSTDRR